MRVARTSKIGPVRIFGRRLVPNWTMATWREHEHTALRVCFVAAVQEVKGASERASRLNKKRGA